MASCWSVGHACAVLTLFRGTLAAADASSQHCTGMTKWLNTIQCLGSDDIMSLGIKSFATEGVGTKNCSGNSQCIPGFMMGYWIHDRFLDSRLVPGFTMGSWIHDGFLDSRWVPGFTMGPLPIFLGGPTAAIHSWWANRQTSVHGAVHE